MINEMIQFLFISHLDPVRANLVRVQGQDQSQDQGRGRGRGRDDQDQGINSSS